MTRKTVFLVVLMLVIMVFCAGCGSPSKTYSSSELWVFDNGGLGKPLVGITTDSSFVLKSVTTGKDIVVTPSQVRMFSLYAGHSSGSITGTDAQALAEAAYEASRE